MGIAQINFTPISNGDSPYLIVGHMNMEYSDVCPFADPEYQRQVEAYIERIQTAEGSKLQCRACQKITHAKSKATMVNHVEATHIQATVACNYCNKTFKARSYLKNHLKKCGPAS